MTPAPRARRLAAPAVAGGSARLPLLALGLAGILAGVFGCDRDAGPWRRDFATMGTVARLELHGGDPALAEPAFAAVVAAFDSVNALMSAWDPASELSRLNRAPAGSTVHLSPWLDDCLAVAESVRELSGGAFDPTAGPLMRLWGFGRREGRLPAPAELDSARALLGGYRRTADGGVVKTDARCAFDLGGVAKGFAIARAAEAVAALGVRDALVDLGGNLRCLGGARGKGSWRVGIRDPEERSRSLAALELTDASIATSGSYERFVVIDGRRYGHVMNPATGRPAEGLLGATVVARDAALGDALSTALFVLGPEGARELLAALPEVDAVLVLPAQGQAKRRVLATRGLEGALELRPGAGERYSLEFFDPSAGRRSLPTRPRSGEK